MNSNFKNELSNLFLHSSIPEEHAQAISEIAESKAKLFETAPTIVSDKLGSATASFITLCAAIASRRETDKFKTKKKHTDREIEDFLKSLFRGAFVESVFILSFDADGRAIACDFVGEGTANFSDVVPLKLLERAKRRGASSVIIAHNHPLGDSSPSVADFTSTIVIKEMFSHSEIKLTAHYVISGGEASKIDPMHL